MLLQIWADEDRVPPWTGELELRDAETGAAHEAGFRRRRAPALHARLRRVLRLIQTLALRSGGRYAGISTSQSLESVIFGDLIRVRGIA